MAPIDLAVIADDLSGATESAATALVRVSRSMVLLSPARAGVDSAVSNAAPSADDGAPSVLTFDTHSRHLDPGPAAVAARAAAAVAGPALVVVKKVDSLLRGNLAEEVSALREALGRVPVVATSLPRLHRVVRDGVLRVDGTPLHETSLWHLEATPPPSSVSDALAPLATTVIAQGVVDAGVEAIADALRAAAAADAVPVCDADDEASLGRIAEAARLVWERPLLVGSSALVAAAVSCLRSSDDPGHTRADSGALTPTADDLDAHAPGVPGNAHSVLVVVGTRAHHIETQLDRLASSAAYRLVLDPGEVLDRAYLDVTLPSTGVSVVALDPGAPVDPSRSTELATALAAAVAPVAGHVDAIVATGGETARALLDALGVTRLDVVAEIEPGAVVSRTPTGKTFVTRPGSFGDADSLLRITRWLLGSGATTEENS